ncbi:MAG: TIGR02221 family CRISPR-associated protein [Thiolinea sp.]
MHKLVTLLGRPLYDKEKSEYKEAIYQVEGCEDETPSRYICLKLNDYIRPDELIILGTTGSMWGNFLEYALIQKQPNLIPSLKNLINQLNIDYKQDTTNQVDLNSAAEILSNVLDCRCHLHLIPYGRTVEEQTKTLKIMLDLFDPKDVATIDVTHGLRHLPILMQQSALLLQSLKNVKINKIYYGALDLTRAGKTPVMQLEGLLEIDRWTKAFHRYEQDGDYTAFKEPLKNEELPIAALNALEEAAYYERTFNLTEAGKKLDIVKGHLPDKFDGIGSFFTERFKKHITWSDKSNLQKRQGELANFYLKNGDFVRACIFALESFITSLLEKSELPQQQDYHTRIEAVKDFRKPFPKSHYRNTKKRLKNYYDRLNFIRNALAHGTEPDISITDLMQNPLKLEKELQLLFNRLGI